MHPSKLARIHTLQEKKREEKSTTMWEKSGSILVFPIMQATKRTTRLPCTKSQAQSINEQPPEIEEIKCNRSGSTVLSSDSSRTR